MSAGKLTWGRRDWLGLMVLFLSSITADVIGALLAVGALELLRNLVLPRLQEGIPFLSFDIGASTFLLIYVLLAVSGLLIGLIGSAFAMRRYLKV